MGMPGLVQSRLGYSSDALAVAAGRHVEPLASPQAVHTLVVDLHSTTLQFLMRQTVAAPSSAPGELV
jgi:hypothetical protein